MLNALFSFFGLTSCILCISFICKFARSLIRNEGQLLRHLEMFTKKCFCQFVSVTHMGTVVPVCDYHKTV